MLTSTYIYADWSAATKLKMQDDAKAQFLHQEMRNYQPQLYDDVTNHYKLRKQKTQGTCEVNKECSVEIATDVNYSNLV